MAYDYSDKGDAKMKENWTIVVSIKNTQLNMFADSGSSYTLFPIREFVKNFPDVQLHKCRKMIEKMDRETMYFTRTADLFITWGIRRREVRAYFHSQVPQTIFGMNGLTILKVGRGRDDAYAKLTMNC